MLFKHSIVYFFGRGLAALVTLLALVVYTRLLEPEHYGIYALIYTTVLLAKAVFFSWLRMGLLRFLPQFEKNSEKLLSTIAFLFVLVVSFGFILNAPLFFINPFGISDELILLGYLLFGIYGVFEMNLEIARSVLKPYMYSFAYISKAMFALLFSVTFIFLGLKATALLLGLIIGLLIPSILISREYWKQFRFKYFDKSIAIELCKYGLPLTYTFILTFVISSSDRLLLGYYLDLESVGFYEVGYDLAKKSLFTGMMAINLSAFPLVIRALEKNGIEKARDQLSDNLVLLSSFAIPAAVGFALLASNISSTLLGDSYIAVTVKLIPWVVLATVLDGFRAFYYDQSFHLSKYSRKMFWIFLPAAFINIGLNMLLIPLIGIMGAVYSTIISYVVAFGISIYLGRKVFPLPFPFIEISKILIATFGMGLVLWPLSSHLGVLALFYQLTVGIVSFGFFAYLLNISEFKISFNRLFT